MSTAKTQFDGQGWGRWLYPLGGVLTVVYLCVVFAYAAKNWNVIVGLPPNELGDALAGTFAPLAFAWLVLGFLQQGIELRQNSTALRLQADELKTAAEHAGQLVELQRRDIDLRVQALEEERKELLVRQAASEAAAARERFHKSQPRFEFGLGQRHTQRSTEVKAELTNRGAACSSVQVEMMPSDDFKLEGNAHYAQFGTGLRVPVHFLSTSREPQTRELKISYVDIDGASRAALFIVSVGQFLQFSKTK